MNLLVIPLRQARPMDLGNELSQIIQRDYFQTPSSFHDDLATVTALRNKVGAITNESVSTSDVLLLQEYYLHLIHLKRKFPPDSIEFAWYGTLTYGLSGPAKLRSFSIEQLNVLFQLGSLFSQLALKESRHTDEGLKQGCAKLQLAAGCFQMILLEQEAGIPVPNDFTHDTIQALKWLMLAQAQEMVWQKAVSNGKMKDSVIAKLAIQTSEFYSEALKYGNASDYIKLEWINHITVKKFHFRAAAFYRASMGYQDTFQYGEQVCCLRVASESVSFALKLKKYVNSFVIEDLQGLVDTIERSLKVAEKDNDLIYLKVVPNEKDLKPLVGTVIVKPIEPKFEEPTKPLFEDLLPYIVIQVSQAFRERIDNYIKEKFANPVVSLNKMMIDFLTERNLPASIDSLQQPENLPELIIKHSQEIIGIGGTNVIEESITETSQIAGQCKGLLQECKNRIQLEAQEDDMLRLRQGTQRWTRESSSVAGQKLFPKVEKMELYLQQAEAGDKLVLSKYYDLKPYLEIYCGGYKTLVDYIPSSNYTQLDQNITSIISDIRAAVNEARNLEDSRKDLLRNVELKTKDNPILPKVIEDYKVNKTRIYQNEGVIREREFEGVFELHLGIYNKELMELEALKNKQISLESEIDMLNKRFISEFNIRVSESQQARGESLQVLESVYSKYLDIISNLNEGNKFYNDFILKGTGVLKECEDFLYKRRMEGRELELSIQHDHLPARIPPDEVCPKSQAPHDISLAENSAPSAPGKWQ
ncbi:BRO1-domain-containing protein [Suhomyces tanzawaensis NRRL Y-17324]|uniref:BRO1-domain-containing protein n=1 Tax=Suhomyces tanzawaensis NRRL Y-17324 TaxID=984487 RepID=A0A1E4SDA6_9ASCO|nr:BRO1-domain-containing protein [Suhomyces tanzawaensis NRRL Y-17324]ODV77446.1 BRO1-domain-containing protein [Suhomyces tanzawaensis NRRL Y-17324]